MILIVILHMLFASTFTFGKAALTYIKPVMFVAIRMITAGSLLLGYQYFFQRKKWGIAWRDWPHFLAVSFFLIFISFIAEFWAMLYVSAAKACLVYNLSPFITALLSYWLFKDRLTGKQWVGLCIGMTGFIPIFMNQMPAEALTKHVGFISMPELALIIAVASSCYGWIAMKQLVVHRSYSTIMVNGVAMLVGGFLSGITALLFEPAPWIHAAKHPLWDVSPLAYAWLVVIGYAAFLIIIANVICFNLYSFLMHRYSLTLISFVGFTTPLFAALFDFLYFGQGVPISFILTVGIVGVGIYIFYQDELAGQVRG